MSNWEKRVTVGVCTCALGLGLLTESVAAHEPTCPRYGRDIVMCGPFIEAVMPPHIHGTEIGTPSLPGAATVVSSTGVATTWSVKLGEGLSMSDRVEGDSAHPS